MTNLEIVQIFLASIGQLFLGVMLVCWVLGLGWVAFSLLPHLYRNRAEIRRDRQAWKKSAARPYRPITRRDAQAIVADYNKQIDPNYYSKEHSLDRR